MHSTTSSARARSATSAIRIFRLGASRKPNSPRVRSTSAAFVSCQDEYSLVVRGIEKDLLPAAQEYRLGLLPFFPLASGLLTGKYKRGSAAPDDTRFGKMPALRDRYVTARNEDIVEKLQAFAKRGHGIISNSPSPGWPRVRKSQASSPAPPASSRSSRTSRRSRSMSTEEIAEIDGIRNSFFMLGSPSIRGPPTMAH